jgi:hypothetical protein
LTLVCWLADNLGMQKRSSMPRDPNQLAKLIADMATGEAAPEPMPQGREKNPAAVALGKLGGAKGGKARAAKLTPEERSAIAKRAAAARWGSVPRS